MKLTRSQTDAQGLAHNVGMEPRQAAQRRFTHKFILDWYMPVRTTSQSKPLSTVNCDVAPSTKKYRTHIIPTGWDEFARE